MKPQIMAVTTLMFLFGILFFYIFAGSTQTLADQAGTPTREVNNFISMLHNFAFLSQNLTFVSFVNFCMFIDRRLKQGYKDEEQEEKKRSSARRTGIVEDEELVNFDGSEDLKLFKWLWYKFKKGLIIVVNGLFFNNPKRQQKFFEYLNQNNEKLFVSICSIMVGFNILAAVTQYVFGVQYLGAQIVVYQFSIFNIFSVILMSMLQN